MDSDLLIPLFWTLTFASLITIGIKRLTKKAPTDKKWVRPEREKDKQ